MTVGQFGYRFSIPMPVRRKIFISYHHGGDQKYYDAFSKTFHDEYEAVTDNSLERAIDSDDVAYVLRRIRENHISGTSCTVVLVGADTWGRKYVDWEIDATLQKKHGLIGVWLPSLPVSPNGGTLKPDRLQANVNSGYAVWVTWKDFTASVEACRGYIEQANARDKELIDNSIARRLSNA